MSLQQTGIQMILSLAGIKSNFILIPFLVPSCLYTLYSSAVILSVHDIVLLLYSVYMI